MTIPFSPSPETSTPDVGQSDGFIMGAAFSALNNRTEGNVKSQLAAQMQNDNTWSALWDVFFGFIKAPFEWVWAAMKRLFPFIDWQSIEEFDFWATAAWVIDQLEQVPFVGDIVTWITGATSGTWETLQVWFGNVREFFAHINFFADDFDLLAAAEDFLDFILFPVGRLASMAGLEEVAAFVFGISSAITGFVGTSIAGTIATVTEWFGNLKEFFAHINFLDPNFDLLAAAEDFIDFILFPVGKIADILQLDEIWDWLSDFVSDLFNFPAQFIGSIGNVLMDGVASVGGFLSSLWGALTGQGGSGKTVANVATAAGGVASTAGTAFTNAQNALNSLGDLVWKLLNAPAQVLGSIGSVIMDGVASIGSFLTGLWNSLTGQSGTDKKVADVTVAAAGVTSTTNTASTNASTALTNNQSTVDNLYDAFDGTTGSTGRTVSQMRQRGAAVRSSAVTGEANASTALTNAATAQTQANLGVTNAAAAQTAAGAADTKALAAQGFANNALKAGSNILPNGGFENTSFYTGNGVYETAVKLSGSYSMKLTGSGVRINLTTGFQSADTFVNSQPCRPLSTFYVEGWVYGDPANAGGGSINLYIDDYNAAGVLQPQQAVGMSATTALRGVWTKVYGTITVSAAAASVYIFIYQSGQPATDKYYYDNFVAYEITEAQAAQLDADAAQANAATGIANAATAQTQADLGVTNAAAADGKAAAAQATASAAVTKVTYEAALAGGINMATNPSFEDTTQFIWAGAEYSTDFARTGTRSAKLVANGADRYVTFIGTNTELVYPNVTPGQVFYIEWWMYQTGGTTTAVDGSTQMYVQWYNGPTYHSASSFGLNSSTAHNGVWTKVSGLITVPANNAITRGRFLIRMHSNTNIGTVRYYDDVVMRDVTEAYYAQLDADAAQADATTGITNAAAAQGAAGTAQTAADNSLAAHQTRVQQGPNMVFDGGFENGNVWNPVLTGQWSRSTAQARSGSYSARVACNGVTQSLGLNIGPGGVSTGWNTMQGKKYVIEGWVYAPTTNSNATGLMQIWSAVRTRANTWVYNPGGAPGIYASGLTKGVWTKVSAVVNLDGIDAQYWYPYLRMDATCVNGDVFFWDDVYVTEYTGTQDVIDNTVQAVAGGTTTGNTLASLKTNVGVVNTQANLGVTNAGIAQGAANTAQATVEAVAASGANMVISPNFEDTTIARQTYSTATNATYEYTTEDKYQGTHSFKWTVVGQTWNGPYLSPTSANTVFAVKEGDTISVKTRVKAKSTNTVNGTSTVSIYMRWTSSAGGTTDTSFALTDSFLAPSGGSAGGWAELNHVATCPAGRDRLQVFVLSNPTTPVGNSFYIDAVSVREETSAQTALTNAAAANTAAGAANTAAGAAATAASNAADAASAADTKALAAQNALTTSIISGANLCVNPGFENTDYKFAAPASTSYATDLKRSGARSAKMIGITGQNIDVSYFASITNGFLRLPVQAGDVLYFEAWIRGGTGNTKTAGAIRPYLYSGDPAAPTVSYPTNIAAYTGTLVDLNAGWQKLSGYYTVPAGGVALEVVVQLHTSAGTGCILHVDDMVCYRVTEGYVADGKAVAAETKAQGTIDNVVQGIAGGTSTGNSLATLKTNAFNVQATAADGVNKANAADTKAVTAQTVATTALKTGWNLVPNNSFEDSTIYLVGAGNSYSTAQARSGTRSLMLTGAGSPYSYLFGTTTAAYYLPCKPGDVFRYTYWVYGNGSNTVGESLRFGINCRTNTGANVAYSVHDTSAPTSFNNVWTQVTGTVTLSTNSTVTQFDPYIQRLTSTGGTFYFDDVVLERITESNNAKVAADAAQGNVENTWNELVNAFDGVTGSTGKTAADVRNRGAVVRQTGIAAKSLAITALQSGPNLATNGSFENTNLFIYKDANRDFSPEQKRTGTQSWKTVGAKWAPLFSNETAYTPLPCTDSDRFYAEIWVYGKSDNPAANNGATMHVQTWNAAGTLLQTTYFPAYFSAAMLDATRGVWTKMSGYFTPAAGATTFQITHITDSTNTTLYWDDFACYRVTETANLNTALYGPSATTPGSAILTAQVPNGIDATKLTGTLDNGRIPTITNAKLGSDIDASKLAAGTLPVARIADQAITGSKIAANSIASGNIADNAVTTAKILDGAVTASELASAAVTNAKIATDAVAAENIQANAVTTDKVLDGAITANELANLAVTTAKIGDAQITGLKVAANTIDAGTKLTGTVNDNQIPTINTTKIPTLDRSKLLNPDFSNALQDGGFETTSWGTSGSGVIATIADPKVGGTKVLSVASSGAVLDSYMHPRDIPVSPGEVWYGECWVRKTTAGGTGTYQLGTTVAKDGGSLQYPLFFSADVSTLTQNVWTKISGFVTIPDAINQLTIRPSVGNNVAAGTTIQFDNVVVRKATQYELADSAVTTAKVADAGITGGKIAAGTIDAGTKLSGTVANAQIPTITNAKLGSDIDAAKLTAGTLSVSRIADAAITGTKIAATTIGAGNIADSAVIAAKIATDAVTEAKLAGSAVTATKIGTGAVTDVKIATDAVTSAKIATNAVTDVKINAGAVTTAKVGDAQITGLKVAASTLDAGTKLTGTVADGQLGPIRDLAIGQINSGANLLPNPGFERLGFVSSSLFVTEQKRSGTRSLKLTANGANYIGLGLFSDNVSTFNVSVAPNDVYYYEVWYRGHANNPRHRQLLVSATGGTFTITVGANTTTAIAYNATAATVQAALVALASVGAGNATVTAVSGASLNVSPGLTIVFGASVTGAISTTSSLTGGGLNLFNNSIFMQASSVNQNGVATGYPSVGVATADDDNGVWKKLAGYVTIPAGTAELPTVSTDFRQYMNYPMPNGVIYYFDDAFLARVTDANQINKALYGPSANTPASQILTATIPNGVDATKLSGTIDEVRLPTISNAKIGSGIDGAKLTDGTIGNVKIASGVDAGKLTAGTLSVDRIANAAITGAKIAGTTIAAGNIADNAIIAAKIAADAVTDTKIASNAVTGVKIAVDAVTDTKIAVNAVTTAKVADAQITGLKVAANTIDAGTKLTGTVADAQIPQLEQSKVNGLPADVTVNSTLLDHTQKIQTLESSLLAAESQGKKMSVNFANYPGTAASPGELTDFTVDYPLGTGTSTVKVVDGLARWVTGTNADRTARIVYTGNANENGKTLTNFQSIKGTLGSIPGVGSSTTNGPRFWAIARVSDDKNSYVWARAVVKGSSILNLKAEMGCTINGVETIWRTDIPLAWSLDMTFVAGANGNERAYQVYSGTTLVATWEEGFANLAAFPSPGVTGRLYVANDTGLLYTWNGSAYLASQSYANLASFPSPGVASRLYVANDTGLRYTWNGTAYVSSTLAASLLGDSTATSNYRRWGAITEVKVVGGTLRDGGAVAAAVTSDNAVSPYKGSVARMIRTSTATATFASGENVLPQITSGSAGFFITQYETLDVDSDDINGIFTVAKSKMYMVTARIRLTTYVDAVVSVNLQVRLAGSSTWTTVQRGSAKWNDDWKNVGLSNGGLTGSSIDGTWLQYLNAGDSIRLTTQRAGGSSSVLTGSGSSGTAIAAGSETYFSISGLT